MSDTIENKKLINNLKSIIRSIIVCPVVWFGTFGNNQICLNFTIFFSFCTGIVLLGYLLSREKIIEDIKEHGYSNDFLNAFAVLVPASFLIADGWIFTGLLWFICWCVGHSIKTEVKKIND